MTEAKQISQFFNNIVSKQHSWKLRLFKKWNEIIGDLKDKVEIERIDGNLLILAAIHSVWAQELFLLSDLLRNKINVALGHEYIKAIRINTKKRTYSCVKKEKKLGKKTVCYDLKKVNLNKIEQRVLEKIADQELKSCLKDFYLRCKRGKNGKKKVFKT